MDSWSDHHVHQVLLSLLADDFFFSFSVSGLSGSTETAQSQVSVGMGLLAGSTVMLLTVIWGSCIIVGTCDLEDNLARDNQDTKGFSLTGLSQFLPRVLYLYLKRWTALMHVSPVAKDKFRSSNSCSVFLLHHLMWKDFLHEYLVCCELCSCLSALKFVWLVDKMITTLEDPLLMWVIRFLQGIHYVSLSAITSYILTTSLSAT